MSIHIVGISDLGLEIVQDISNEVPDNNDLVYRKLSGNFKFTTEENLFIQRLSTLRLRERYNNHRNLIHYIVYDIDLESFEPKEIIRLTEDFGKTLSEFNIL